MSLITTEALRLLYNRTSALDAQEHTAMALWMHYLLKHVFTEEHWVLTQEQPPSSSRRDSSRRCDAVLEHATQLGLRVIAIAEAKRAGGSFTAVEAQLQEACQSSYISTGRPVYGIAIVGVYAKFSHYRAGHAWAEITSAYMDLRSTQSGPIIRNAAMMIKNSVQSQPIQAQPQPVQTRPQPVQAQSQSQYQYPTQGGQIQPTQAASQTSRPAMPAGHGWIFNSQHNRYYRSDNRGGWEWFP